MTAKRFDVIYEEDEEYKNIRYWEIIDRKNNVKTSNELKLCHLLNLLNEENEQLKAQLLYDGDGVCNICKHQCLVENGKYYVAKCEKEHEECSKVDLQYCEDFEKELKE